MTSIRPIVDAFREAQWKPTVILAGSPVLLLSWKYFCAAEAVGAVGHFVGCFVLLGLVPALLVKALFRERLRDYGVGLGDPRRTFATLAVLAGVFVLAAYIGANDPAVRSKFPINPRAGDSASLFALHAATYLLYYIGWEFHFRGFLLFGLRGAIGEANAVLVQVMASALLHIGSPAAETFGAIPAGILWGVLAIYTRSLLSGLGQHYLLGVALDAFICFGGGTW